MKNNKPSSIWTRSAIAALLLCATTSPTLAATVRGQLRIDEQGRSHPASGVAVTVRRAGSGRSSPAYTGGDGMYYMSNIKPGQYNLEVWSQHEAGSAPMIFQIQVVEPNTDIRPIVIR